MIEWKKILPPPGFRVLPRRWVVERTFSWLGQSRRLSKDYERLCESSEAMVCVCHHGSVIADYHCMYENKAALRHAQDRLPQMAKVALAQALQTVTARMDRREYPLRLSVH